MGGEVVSLPRHHLTAHTRSLPMTRCAMTGQNTPLVACASAPWQECLPQHNLFGELRALLHGGLRAEAWLYVELLDSLGWLDPHHSVELRRYAACFGALERQEIEQVQEIIAGVTLESRSGGVRV